MSYRMQAWRSRDEGWRNMEDGAASRTWRPRKTALEAISKCDAWTGGLGIPAMQVIEIDTGRVVWRDARHYPAAGESIGIVDAESVDDLLGLLDEDGEPVGPNGIDRCAVRTVADRTPWEGLWACVCGREYVTYDAGRVCFVRIVGAGYIYGQVWDCDDCHRDLLATHNGRVNLQEALF